MAVPVAPDPGAPILEAWGQVVHDSIVAMDLQAGQATVALNAAAQGTTAITFPRPFASAPIIVVTPVIGSTTLFATVTVLSATGATLQLVRKDGVATTTSGPVHWIAYGPRA